MQPSLLVNFDFMFEPQCQLAFLLIMILTELGMQFENLGKGLSFFSS